MISFPTSPEQVEAPWLAAALARSAREGSAGEAVPLLERTSWEEIGTGQVGRCVRFRLHWAKDGGSFPQSVVAKFPSSDPTSRAAAKAQSCYAFEVGFYRDLRSTVSVRTPRCYVAEIDETETEFVLLLEDLAPARAGDQIAGCDVAVANEAMRQLAALHARWWGDPSLREVEWLSATDEARAAAVTQLYRTVLPGFVARFGAVLSRQTVAICREVGDVLPALLAANRSQNETVVHRDFRLDNLMVDGADEPRIAVVDWQTVGRGGGAGDAAYFVGASLRPEVRRAHEKALFGVWCDELDALGVEELDRARLWDEYRIAALGGVVMSVISAMLVGVTERGDRMFTVMAERHAGHAAELSSLDLVR